ncbi:MAG: VOC family protein [Candidatus Nitrosocosmicus sp.]|jgi:catechol 2,3-dioxygenase-like lactoylglutathione lyase family enzyme|nr:glyoxalase [Candidatus Nitrosocosmicus sp.]
MLGEKTSSANIAVKDLEIAKNFYENTLGLKRKETFEDEVIVYKSGNSSIVVYRSEFAGTNKATCVTWAVGDDIEKIVSDLKNKGVRFEHYDIPNAIIDGDIHIDGNMKVAWFRDPDGNILNLINQ